MKISSDLWQARAALLELLALSFRYPENTLVDAITSGEWDEAAHEIAGALGLAYDMSGQADEVTGSAEAYLHKLRAEATYLFIGSPDPAVSPYEGVWRAGDDGVQALLFVNPHSMDVERFCKACGLAHPAGTNEPLDYVATELELLQYLALRAACKASGAPLVDGEEGGVADADLPEGSPEGAYDFFIREHASTWMGRFAEKLEEVTRMSFYRRAARLLSTFTGAFDV